MQKIVRVNGDLIDKMEKLQKKEKNVKSDELTWKKVVSFYKAKTCKKQSKFKNITICSM